MVPTPMMLMLVMIYASFVVLGCVFIVAREKRQIPEGRGRQDFATRRIPGARQVAAL
jgi:hypothetical protein